MASTPHILLLAGTFEARTLARTLLRRLPDVRLTVSFAGVVRDLPELGGQTRIGGFGGTGGLTDYLRAEQVTLVIDATHPFAARMSRHAFAATGKLDLPLVRLDRPAWAPKPGDFWQGVGSFEAAAQALPADARAFLAVGRKEIDRFCYRDDMFGLARMIEPPATPLPDHWCLVLSRPAPNVDSEIALLEHHRITHVVSKNSGGTRSCAKIEAARALRLPVIMIARPVLPKAMSAGSSDEVFRIVSQALGQTAAPASVDEALPGNEGSR